MRLTPPNAREKLAANLVATSKAYGYTLCVWGSGAVLIAEYGLPQAMAVLLYVVGAVTGFGLLATVVYGTLFSEVEEIHEDHILAATMIHYVAAPLTVAGSLLIARHTHPMAGFFLAGANATIGYNVLLLVESLVYEELNALEDRLLVHIR